MMLGVRNVEKYSVAEFTVIEALRGNVMSAEEPSAITYLNPAVIEQRKEAQQDLKRELLGNLKTLIDENFGETEHIVAPAAAFDSASNRRNADVAKSTEMLTNAAQSMTGIVGLVSDVANQINLLALNATIESARAGKAGQGFRGVAAEVKNLAIRAATVTHQISKEIESIQDTSASVAQALNAIRDSAAVVCDDAALSTPPEKTIAGRRR